MERTTPVMELIQPMQPLRQVNPLEGEGDLDTQFYRFVVAFAIINGLPPTLKEVGAGIGITSNDTLVRVRNRLIAAGKLAPHVKGLTRDLIPASLVERAS